MKKEGKRRQEGEGRSKEPFNWTPLSFNFFKKNFPSLFFFFLSLYLSLFIFYVSIIIILFRQVNIFGRLTIRIRPDLPCNNGYLSLSLCSPTPPLFIISSCPLFSILISHSILFSSPPKSMPPHFLIINPLLNHALNNLKLSQDSKHDDQ